MTPPDTPLRPSSSIFGFLLTSGGIFGGVSACSVGRERFESSRLLRVFGMFLERGGAGGAGMKHPPPPPPCYLLSRQEAKNGVCPTFGAVLGRGNCGGATARAICYGRTGILGHVVGIPLVFYFHYFFITYLRHGTVYRPTAFVFLIFFFFFVVGVWNMHLNRTESG